MEQGCLYHIYNRGIKGEKVFRSEDNYKFFLGRWKKYMSSYANMVAYCLMPTHFHFIIEARSEEWPGDHQDDLAGSPKYDFPRAFGVYLMSYVKAYNKRYHRHGPLFQAKFKRKRILSARQFEIAIVYVHANPVASGLCSSFEGWPYSSYLEYVGQGGSLVSSNLAWHYFEGVDAFKAFHEEYLASRRGE